MKKIELLAPAGNMSSLIAAVEASCDAVYLGGTLFSARAFAGNFTREELAQAVSFCHLYGVKVYVTCNILVYEHEVKSFLEYIDYLCQINVDAVLIQDLGMLDLVHQTYPDLELHASTQMHIHNLDGVIMAGKLGCSRVVLARETSIEQIREIIKNSNVEIEVFAHGSLCISYSGQCLFSSLIGHRSGNRGSCVGSCRLPYKIINQNNKTLNDGDYPLSMKDLCTLEHVGELIESGITSLKIEGRMKSPEYVYVVTRLYREAIDSYYQFGKVIINQELLASLKRIFNRDFTKGYLFNEKYENILNTERPNHQGVYLGKIIAYNKGFVKLKLASSVSINDGLRIILNHDDYGLILNEFTVNGKRVKEAGKNEIISFKVNKEIPINSKVILTKDVSLIKKINDIIANKPRKIPIKIKVLAKINQPIEISVTDYIHQITQKGFIVHEAINNPTKRSDILMKLQKIGNTPYEINDINLILDENIFLPFKELNLLRHELLEKLSNERCALKTYSKKKYQRIVPDFLKKQVRSILVEQKNDNNDNLDYDIIYSKEPSKQNIIKLPKVMSNYDLDNNKTYLVGELGAFNKLKNIYCDYSFNVVNSYTVALLHFLGAKQVTLSLELSKSQIDNIIKAYVKRYAKNPNLEVIVSGYREVMTLKTNLNKLYHEPILYLKDRFNNKYLIKEENHLSYIYEPKKFIDYFNYYDLGVNVLRDNKDV